MAGMIPAGRYRVAAIALALMVASVAVRGVDVRSLMGAQIKGDWATYTAMAVSLARDGDLQYDPGDYTRFTQMFPNGPSGIFLKKRYTLGIGGKTPVDTSQSLTYGKALIYPLVATPFVFVGGVAGMLVLNAALLLLCVYCAARFAGAIAGKWGTAFGAVFILATTVPVYATWLTSEMFNFALVFVAYFLWLYKKVAPPEDRSWLVRPSSTMLGALLIGIATYSKATNIVLIGPLVLDALVARHWRHSAALVLAFLAGSAGLFGVNAAVTGEANYQGAATAADRRSFVDAYPFDDKGTVFELKGSTMSTNDADTGRVLATHMLSQVPVNIFYFFVGRHAGFIPYYFPGALVLVLWLSSLRHAPLWQWSTFVAVAGSVGGLLIFFPDSWNGGGGAPGNRYFLTLYAPLLFLLPAVHRSWPAIVAAAGGLVFVGSLVAHPFHASAEPWKNVEAPPLHWLPIELTLVNDLPVKLNQRRAGILFIPEPTVQVYKMDGGSYDNEGNGWWAAGRATSDTLIKTDKPPKRIKLTFSAPIENRVTGSLSWDSFQGQSFDITLRPNQEQIRYVLPHEGFRYQQNYVYVLRLTTSDGFVPKEMNPGDQDDRNLGIFVKLEFFYDEP